MLLSDLYRQIESAPDALQYSLYLASTDPDPANTVDAYVVRIGNLEIDHEKLSIRLIPGSMTDASGDSIPFLLLDLLMQQLPPRQFGETDFEILVELPLDRESPGYVKSTAPVTALHLGAESEEAWFLARPVSEFPGDVLPD
jgi:hypothetical protein